MPPPPKGVEPTPFVRPGATPRWPLVLSIIGVVAAIAVIVVALLPLLGDDDDDTTVQTATSVVAPPTTAAASTPASATTATTVSGAADTTAAAEATSTSPATSTTVADTAEPTASTEPETSTTRPSTSSSAAASTSTTAPASTATTAAGFPQPVNIALVEATCTAPDSTDSRGNKITFNPLLTVDGVPDTAWRCPGASVHQALLFTLARPSDISAVAAIPGYSGADPYNKIDRWEQNRRVTKARWACLDAGGTELASTEQSFDNTRGMQGVTVTGFTGCTKVVFELLETSGFGNRDFAAVSEIGLYGPA